jgi:hypothetical protein
MFAMGNPPDKFQAMPNSGTDAADRINLGGLPSYCKAAISRKHHGQ